MSGADDVLGLIKLQFAEGDALTEVIYRRDGSFRTLCRDYRDCVETLERLQEDESATSHTRRAEYTELLAELEGEIRDWLRRADVGHAPGWVRSENVLDRERF